MLLTLTAAAKRVHVTPETIRRYIAAGLPVHTINGRRYVLEDALLREYRTRIRNAKATRLR